MARILVISSQVTRGHVGLSAMVPALQALGHDAWAMPTVLLSNHPGHAHVAGQGIDASRLQAMLEALAANGWLVAIDAVVTGYLPSAAHVAFAAAAIGLVRQANAAARVIVDPVLGDTPKGLYIDQAAAAAIRDTLVPLAEVLTPNRFELAWLSGLALGDLASVQRAARGLACPAVVVTSALRPDCGADEAACDTAVGADARQRITSLLVARGADAACTVPWRERVPNGTGDLLAGLTAGHLASGRELREAFARAIAGVDAVVRASAGHDELALVAALPDLARLAPWPIGAPA